MLACVHPARPPAPAAAPAPAATVPKTIRVQVRDGGATIVLAVPLEDYVAATILSEVDPPSAPRDALERMYEVQALVSRTYAVGHLGRHSREGFDLCSTTHCQLYEPGRLRTSRWSAIAYEGARRTAGRIVWFHDAPAATLYHSDCGGRTSTAEDVWGGTALPYLVGARDNVKDATAHTEWTFDTRDAALRDALSRDPRTDVGRRLDAIEVVRRDAAGRAQEIALRGTRSLTVRGEVFREVVGRAFGAKSVRSTLLSVSRTAGGFAFTGRGFGHGVGL